MQYNYLKNWPNAWDQVKEFVEEGVKHYSNLTEANQLKLISKFAIDDKEQFDFVTKAFAEAIPFYITDHNGYNDEFHYQFKKAIEQRYDIIIQAMFEDAIRDLQQELEFIRGNDTLAAFKELREKNHRMHAAEEWKHLKSNTEAQRLGLVRG